MLEKTIITNEFISQMFRVGDDVNWISNLGNVEHQRWMLGKICQIDKFKNSTDIIIDNCRQCVEGKFYEYPGKVWIIFVNDELYQKDITYDTFSSLKLVKQ